MGHHNKLTDADRQEIIRLYRKYGSTAVVAGMLRWSQWTVQRVTKAAGFDLRRGPVDLRRGKCMQQVPPVQPEQLDRVCEAGQRYVEMRNQQWALQRAEYGLSSEPPIEGPWDGRSL